VIAPLQKTASILTVRSMVVQSRPAPCDINGEPAARGFPDLDRASDRPEHFSLPTVDSTLLLPMMRFGSHWVQAPEIAESNRLIECGNGLGGAKFSVGRGSRLLTLAPTRRNSTARRAAAGASNLDLSH